MAFVTLFESDNHVGKYFEINDEGQYVKNQDAFGDGIAKKIRIDTPEEFKSFLKNLTTYQCTCYGTTDKFHINSVDSANELNVYSKGRLKQLIENVWSKDTTTYSDDIKFSVSRTRENFEFKSEPGWLLIDYDPPKGESHVPIREELLEIFYAILPQLRTAPHLWTLSGSSNVWKYADINEAGTKINLKEPVLKDAIRGQRIYVLVSDMSKIPEFMKSIEDHFWLHNYGWVEIDRAGNLHNKIPMDTSTGQPERLDYCAGLIERNGFKQRREDKDFIVIEGKEPEPLNLQDCINNLHLSEADKDEVRKLKLIKRNDSEAEANEVRRKWATKQVERHKNVGNNPLLRAQLVEKYFLSARDRSLFSEFMLQTEKYGNQSVSQLLDNPQKFHNCTMLDPFEPNYMGGGNYRIAKANLFPRGGERAHIYCFAHGNIRYELFRDHTEIEIQPGNFDVVMSQTFDMLTNNPNVYFYANSLFQINNGALFQLNDATVLMMISEYITFFEGVNKEGERKIQRCPVEIKKGVMMLDHRFHEFTRLRGFFRHPVLLDYDKVSHNIKNEDIYDTINDAEHYPKEGKTIKEQSKLRELAKFDRKNQNEKKYILSSYNGYDEKCEMYIHQHEDVQNVDWDKVMMDFSYNPEWPEIEEAFNTLWKAHSLYRFADPSSITFALSSILTAINRPSMDKCPMLLVKAPAIGSGKTKFCQTLGYLIEGKDVPVLPPFNNDEEFDKIMIGVFKKGKIPVIFDNCDRTISSASLSTILTGKEWENRELGTNNNLSFMNTVFIMATGNGIDVVKDLVRRAMVVDINSDSDNPAAKQFPFDPEDEVREHYAEIVKAGLTLINASRNHKLSKILNSFEEWSNIVGRCVEWIGLEVIPNLGKGTCYDNILREDYQKVGLDYEDMEIKTIRKDRLNRFSVTNPCNIISRMSITGMENRDIGEFFRALYSIFGKTSFKSSDIHHKSNKNIEYYPYAFNENDKDESLMINKNYTESDDKIIRMLTSKEFVMNGNWESLLKREKQFSLFKESSNRYNKQLMPNNLMVDFPEFTGSNKDDKVRALGYWLKEHKNKKSGGFELLLIDSDPKRGNKYMINIYDEDQVVSQESELELEGKGQVPGLGAGVSIKAELG